MLTFSLKLEDKYREREQQVSIRLLAILPHDYSTV
jgi:hypothetical protein